MTVVLEPAAMEDLQGDTMPARREQARSVLGFGSNVAVSEQNAEPFRAALKNSGVSLYPIAALGGLGIVDLFQSYAFTVLTPNIMHTLGLSLTTIGLARALSFLTATLAPLPIAALSRRGGRVKLCLITAFGWSAITLLTGFCVSLLALVAVLILDGLSTGSVGALHQPLVVDSYPPTVRVRALTGYAGITKIGTVLSPLLVALLAGPFNLDWRGIFLVMGLTSLASTFFALGLREPAFGAMDTEKVHELAEGENSPFDAVPEAAPGDDVSLGFFEVLRRLLLIPTIQRLCLGFLVFGIMTIALLTFVSSYLDVQWGLGDSGRGYFLAGTSVASVAALVVFGRYAEKFFRNSPARIINFSGLALIGGVLSIGIGAALPSFTAMFLCFSLGFSLFSVLSPGLGAALLSIVDGPQRPHLASVIGLFVGLGGVLGTVLLGQVTTEYGLTGAIVSLIVPGVAGGFIIRSAKNTIEADLDGMITKILETEDIAALTASGGRLPMLSTRGINFSYGQLQVLFDVDFTVDDGEMVALLGTNGAGKSTLLKVISGIGLPQAGAVRYRGQDITYLDAERRLRLGITQIPGGRAVFGPMDVIENLRAFAYAAKGSKADTEEAIERCLETFPRLRERRTSLASTLSGGEQQMLGLSKALILKPQLLLIDELSLGLAPIIVGQLIDLVRAINAEGTAVVLVEQSVNIALSLVNHAYFMEKGQMRFDGPAADLLGREDLLRAVFLEGATKGQEKIKKSQKAGSR